MASGRFMALAYAKLRELGIDTDDKSPEEVVALYERLSKKEQGVVGSMSGKVKGEKGKVEERKLTNVQSEDKK